MHTWIRRASDLFQWGSGKSRVSQKSAAAASDGELVFCKNNICVHPPVSDKVGVSHHPGYLTIKAQSNPAVGCTLWLTWIPNTSLKKHPHSLENRSSCSSPCRSTCPSSCPSVCPSPTTLKRIAPFLEARCSDAGPSRVESSQGWNEGQSISSLASDAGSPREGAGSPDSWTASDRAEMTASTVGSPGLSLDPSDAESGTVGGQTVSSTVVTELSATVGPPAQSQTDSGIGPEEVTAALESMISCLDRIGDGRPDVGWEGTDLQKIADSAIGSLSEKECRGVAETSAENIVPTTRLARTSERPTSLGQPTEDFKRNSHSTLDSVRQHGTVGSDEADVKEATTVARSKSQTSFRDSVSSSDAPTILFPVGGERLGSGSSSSSTCSSSSSSSGRPVQKSRMVLSDSLRTRLLLQEGTPESFAHAHNLAFPEETRPVTSPNSARSPSASRRIALLQESPCGTFSVDLGHMRSLRLLFSDRECTSGQLVIASKESQYKIFHFHHGGLDRLAHVLGGLDFLLKGKQSDRNESCPYAHFSVWKPQVRAEECHPEEGAFLMVDESVWRGHMTPEGVIEDELQLRKAIFFKGLDPKLRKEVWPFLLQHYSFSSTLEEREQIRNDRYIEYQNIRMLREQMNAEERECFWRNVECIVEKDVVRTDRTNPFYVGENNPNIDTMQNILLNYAAYHPWMGYTQGMSDLLAPVLAEMQDEAQAFWCFVGLMQHTIFVSSPKDGDMDTNLNYLRELLRVMTPRFYEHLSRRPEALELLFVHRWLLLCLKREFRETEALQMWESCWACHQTSHFHLFLCTAIVALYGGDAVAQDLRPDEMLLYFSSLAMHMDGELVLRKARGLLHQFRLLPRIPCTLAGLCELCGPGMWDSRPVPRVECRGHCGEDRSCPWGGQDPPPGAPKEL